MMRVSKRALLELILDLVDEHGSSWREKREDLLSLATDDEKRALGEFGAWFDGAD